MEHLRYKPSGLWKLDDTAPFQDYSGYNRSATLSGTEKHGISLSSYAAYSQVLSNDTVASFDCPVYRAGRESDSFSLAASVAVTNETEGYVEQPYRENLVSNPSLETNLDNWAAARGTGNRVTTRRKFGYYSYEFTTTAVEGAHYLNLYNPLNPVPITPGREYTSSIYIWRDTATAPVDSGTNRLQLYWVDANNSIIGSAITGSSVPTGDYWARMHITATAPENAVGINIYAVVATNRPAGEKYYFDGLMVNEGGLIPYFDGSMPGYEWTGTAHGSKSKSIVGINKINLMGNPSLDSSKPSRVVGVRVSSTWVSEGLRILSTDSTSVPYIYAFGIYGPPSSRVGPVFQNDVVGASVKITAYTNIRVRVAIAAYKIDGTGAGGEQTILVGDFIDLVAGESTTLGSVAKLTDDSTAGVLPIVYLYEYQSANLPASVGSGFTLENVIVQNYGQNSNRTTAPEYFDGDTPGAAWAGTPGDSNSYMLASNGQQQVLSNQNTYDGITVDGTTVSFSTKYVNTGEAKCSYDIQVPRKIDVVGVHTAVKNTLYIDGVLVDEVNITPEQQQDTYIAPNNNLYSGLSDSSQGLLLNTVAVYTKPLTAEEVARIYLSNNRRPSASIPRMFEGEEILVSALARHPDLNVKWFTDDDWNNAVMEGVGIDDNIIFGSDTGGIWTDTIDLYSGDAPSALESVNIYWHGQNVTVEASIDNETWVAVEKDKNLPIIPSGFDPTDKALYIRILFESDESFVESLEVKGYITTTTDPITGRPITYTSQTVPLEEHEPAQLRSDWGVKVNGGSITIQPAPVENEQPINPQTIEIWVKQGPGESLDRTVVANASYTNGVGSTTTPPLGQWAIMHFTSDTPATGIIRFSGDIQIGRVAFYPNKLTASQIATIYANYLGVPKSRQDGSGVIQLSEPVQSATVYAHDWEIVAS